ncbi:MAG: hypothetical protein ABI361_06925 [Nitrososphaera sp.]|jgi:hypothetical protein
MDKGLLFYTSLFFVGSAWAFVIPYTETGDYAYLPTVFNGKVFTLKDFWAWQVLTGIGSVIGAGGVIVAVLTESEEEEPDAKVSVTYKGHRVISFTRKEPGETEDPGQE